MVAQHLIQNGSKDRFDQFTTQFDNLRGYADEEFIPISDIAVPVTAAFAQFDEEC